VGEDSTKDRRTGELKRPWRMTSRGPTLTVHLDHDLDGALSRRFRDAVLELARARRPQRVVVDLGRAQLLDDGAARSVARLLTLLEHDDREVQVRMHGANVDPDDLNARRAPVRSRGQVA
jgi:hypothetical protein